MAHPAGEMDITRNIRTIEWLRTELIAAVAALTRAMFKGANELIIDALAGIIMTAYLLGRRMGISFSRMDAKLSEKLADNVSEPYEIEQWYGDISALKTYIEDKARSESAVIRGIGR